MKRSFMPHMLKRLLKLFFTIVKKKICLVNFIIKKYYFKAVSEDNY